MSAEAELEEMRGLLAEVYHAMVRAGWRDDDLLERVRKAKEGAQLQAAEEGAS